MNSLSTQYSYMQPDPSGRFKGIVVVAAAHVLIGWGLFSGMGVTALHLIKPPPMTTTMVDVPPPPVVKKIIPPDAPPTHTETYMPKPDIAPTETNNSVVIESTPVPPPVSNVIAPPTPAVQARSGPTDIRLACPTQVPPDMPRKAIQDGATGVVRAQVLIQNGQVRDVTILSGPRLFHAAVKTAMMQYRCTNDGAGDVTAVQEFNFRLE